MSAQQPSQQPPSSLQRQRDHKTRLREAEIRGRAHGAILLESRTDLHELVTVAIAAAIVGSEDDVAFHGSSNKAKRL